MQPAVLSQVCLTGSSEYVLGNAAVKWHRNGQREESADGSLGPNAARKTNRGQFDAREYN